MDVHCKVDLPASHNALSRPASFQSRVKVPPAAVAGLAPPLLNRAVGPVDDGVPRRVGARPGRSGWVTGRSSSRGIPADRTSGGHVLDFTLGAGHIAISTAFELHLRLPTSGAFLHAHLSGEDVSAQIHHAEGGD